ncbi:MAG: pseudouridine synthase [Salinivirgaceae bacterium]|nr:pseudouridine synthase [Salinivirgaceae bacterium]
MNLFQRHISPSELPQQFTYPFCYTPHPLCIEAKEIVMKLIASKTEWHNELQQGKMFGVLVVEKNNQVGFLSAFSGNLNGKNQHDYFVPPVFDFMSPTDYFKIEEGNISAINKEIQDLQQGGEYQKLKLRIKQLSSDIEQQLSNKKEALKKSKLQRDAIRQGHPNNETLQKLIAESQFEKAEFSRLKRLLSAKLEQETSKLHSIEKLIENKKNECHQRSAALQTWLFNQFQMLNAKGETRSLNDIFNDIGINLPPSGSGECAAPKLLQYAYINGYKPIAMAEFWYGNSPIGEIRTHGNFYPSCRHKCFPILRFMLQGLDVERNPLMQHIDAELTIEYEDEYLMIVNKPAGLLSVPGKESDDSVLDRIIAMRPTASGPLIVHRLDQATSGLLIIAKDKNTHALLQQQFTNRLIHKHYAALLDGVPLQARGIIELPLCPNIHDRPRQMVSKQFGKKATTKYQVISTLNQRTLIDFEPLTGRTHQLRIHSAHKLGLNCPIVGDNLYGTPNSRLFLHAYKLLFTHPITLQLIDIEINIPFGINQ